MARAVAEETRTGAPGRQSAAVPDVPRARRVVLKLSGEVFGGGEVGVDPDTVQEMARQIAHVVQLGIQVAAVVGGGNFFRGVELERRGVDRSRADYMGMIATRMNCLGLQGVLQTHA